MRRPVPVQPGGVTCSSPAVMPRLGRRWLPPVTHTPPGR
nr:MAG TPA: hypothetical protein [Caudoviricetes sp.]